MNIYLLPVQISTENTLGYVEFDRTCEILFKSMHSKTIMDL